MYRGQGSLKHSRMVVGQLRPLSQPPVLQAKVVQAAPRQTDSAPIIQCGRTGSQEVEACMLQALGAEERPEPQNESSD